MRQARILETLEALETEARSFATELTPHAERATLVTLSGDLGAGKTTFTQSVAKELGVSEHVTSPTFVLAKSYVLPNSVFKKLVHIDAYRLTEGKDLVPLAFDEVMSDADTLVLLEWPEMVADTLPAPDIAISLSVLDTNSRSISYA